MNVSEIKHQFDAELAQVASAQALEDLRVKYLGRERGAVTAILRGLKNLSIEERKTAGSEANALREHIEAALEAKVASFSRVSHSHNIDLTRPGARVALGHLHPLTLIEQEIAQVFRSMNFSVVEGPEVELERYNFDTLNIPAGHPARDMWDTFWLKRSAGGMGDGKKKTEQEKLLLRTHTSPMQVRYMETHKPPFQIIVPGRVFRYEATDATHETTFSQMEGLVVGPNVSFANFRYVINTFIKKVFGNDVEVELRPNYYPFVEPGFDVYMKWGNQWLEVAGAGMVHPQVFKNVGYDPLKVQGFAFGFGLNRLAMIKYKIPDIRLFYSGDLRFINQF